MNFKNAVKKRKYRLLAKKTKKEAQKLTCAGFILIALGVMGYGLAVKYDLAGKLKNEPKYIQIKEVKAEPVKLEIDNEKQNIERISDYIYFRESSRGKNGYSKCLAIGKVNNIGYGIYDNKWQCFENHAEEMEVLRDWISRKLASGLSERELLGLYSGGSYNK